VEDARCFRIQSMIHLLGWQSFADNAPPAPHRSLPRAVNLSSILATSSARNQPAYQVYIATRISFWRRIQVLLRWFLVHHITNAMNIGLEPNGLREAAYCSVIGHNSRVCSTLCHSVRLTCSSDVILRLAPEPNTVVLMHTNGHRA